MSKSSDELQVVIPYSRLVELLEASEKVSDLTSKCDHLQAQITALHGMFSELGIQFSELKRGVRRG